MVPETMEQARQLVESLRPQVERDGLTPAEGRVALLIIDQLLTTIEMQSATLELFRSTLT